MSPLSVTALVMGLAGSLHCAGMCGPLLLIMPFQWLQGWRKWLGILLYHSGRISVYALMGLILHRFKDLFLPSWQQWVALVSGSLLLLAGLASFWTRGRQWLPSWWVNFIRRQLSFFSTANNPLLLLPAGALNGALPCGMVYMALALTVQAPSGPAAMGVMYAFGAGTLPMLLGITFLQRFLSPLMRSLGRYSSWLLFILGFLFLLRGMNLGIPYVSPKTGQGQGAQMHSCCHPEDH